MGCMATALQVQDTVRRRSILGGAMGLARSRAYLYNYGDRSLILRSLRAEHANTAWTVV